MDQNTPNPEAHTPETAPAPAENTVHSESPAAVSTEKTGESPTLMGILAYIGPLVLIPYFLAKDDSFVKFHVRQGLVLLVISAVTWVLDEIMRWHFLQPVIALINLLVLILAIIGIVHVLRKEEKPLPLVGGYAGHFKV